jgi:hypothetical protein
MPTADDYWRAAADFEARAHELRGDVPPIAADIDDQVVTGGRLRSVLDEAIDAIVSGIGATAAGFEALAAECRRRAVVCEEYTASLGRYHRSVEAWSRADDEERPLLPRLPEPRREPWMRAG